MTKTQKQTKKKGQRYTINSKFLILAAFFILIFMCGGSARKDIPALMLLRPVSVLALFYGLISLDIELIKSYRYTMFLIFSIFLLAVLHIIPLPPSIWHVLPGRSINLELLEFAGLADNWMPFAMVVSGAWNALFSLFVPAAVFLLAIQMSDRDMQKIILLVIALSALSALVGVFQATGNNLNIYAISSPMGGLFANRNHQGALLAITTPIVALAFYTTQGSLQKQVLKKISVFAVAVVLIILALVTGSRMGLILCVISLISTFFIFFYDEAQKKTNTGRYRSIITVVTFLIVVSIFTFIGQYMSRNEAIKRLDNIGSDGRYVVWQQIVEFHYEYMPWGSGLGSYPEIYQIHEPALLLVPSYSNHAHNDWLELLLTTGLPGAALVVLAILMYLYKAAHVFRAPLQVRQFNLAGLLIIVLFAIASIADYPLRTPILAALFALSAAWASRPPSKAPRKERIDE